MTKKTLIHIGYHKTGTTWLQKHLFANENLGFKRYFSKADIRDHLVMPNALDFDSNAVTELYQSKLDEQNLVSVVSSERLSGHPHSGGYDSKELAERLQASFPEAKILIVTREPVSAILSCYQQYVKFGGTCALKDYLVPSTRNLPVIPLFRFKHFDYGRLISYYQDLFGKENVLVLKFEDFRAEPLSFCNAITGFMDLKKIEPGLLPFSQVTNRKLSAFSSTMVRQVNKLFNKTRLNPACMNFNIGANLLIKLFMFLDNFIPKSIHKNHDAESKKLICELLEKQNQEQPVSTSNDYKEDKELLIHIGYHKTGSSWLQDHLFSEKNGAFKMLMSLQEIRDSLVMPNALDFDPSHLDTFKDRLINNDLYPVISNERLSGNPHSGGYDSKEIADRLKASFPNAKILIVIREPKSAIFSSYIQYLRAGGPCSIQDYLNPPERGKPVIPLFDMKHFNYSRLVNYYIDLFGEDKVLVLDFELFKENAQDFCEKICHFTGIENCPELDYQEKTNRRISSLSAMLLRQSNKIFARSTLNPSAIDLNKASRKSPNEAKSNGEKRGNSYKKIISLDSCIPKFVHKFFDNRLKRIIDRLMIK